MPSKTYPKSIELVSELFDMISKLDFHEKITHITTTDVTTTVHLTTTLSESEETVLDDTINNFTDSLIALKVPKIIRLAKKEAKDKHFHNIIYTSNKELEQSLYPKRTTIKGEIVEVCWFEACTPVTLPTGIVVPNFSSLVLKVEIVYSRDSVWAVDRTVTRTYINEDGSENEDKKYSYKAYYSNDDAQINEGIRRRKQLVSSIQKPILEAMLEALYPQNHIQVLLQGRQFLTDYHLDFGKFVDESASETDYSSPNFNKKLIVIKFEEESRPDRIAWLDASPPQRLGGTRTIRQFLIEEFSI